MDVVTVEPDATSFRRCARALDGEADSEAWERDAADEFAEALRPGVPMVQAAVFSTMRTSGLPHGGEGLRQAVSDAVQPVEALRTGARLWVKKTYGTRGFVNAPKRLNDRSWRHPTPRGQVQVTQVGAPGWFDKTLDRLDASLRAAADRVLDRRARRIARKAP